MPLDPTHLSAPSPQRQLAEALLVTVALGGAMGCATPASDPSVEEVFETYTEGVVTEVVEVAPNEWRIQDEQVVPDTADSRVVARRLDGTVTTYSASQLREGAVAGDNNAGTPAAGQSSQQSNFGFGSILLYGLIGRQLFGGGRYAGPQASAYVSPGAYNRVQSTTGQRLGASARSVSKPAGGRSGFGAGRAGRSFGG